MRVDVKDGWCPALKCPTSKVAVFLDDLMLDHCVAADTDEGWADVWKLDSRGKPRVVNNEFMIERRYGRVELRRWKDGARRA